MFAASQRHGGKRLRLPGPELRRRADDRRAGAERHAVPARRAPAATCFGAGVDARVTKYVDLASPLRNTWVSFDNETASLRGGFVHGRARLTTGRIVSERLRSAANTGSGGPNLNDGARVTWFQDFGGAVCSYAPASRRPSIWSGGLIRSSSIRRSTRPAAAPTCGRALHRAEPSTRVGGEYYERIYAPSFGFGGAQRSQELRGYVHMPFSRNRFYVQASAGWRRTDPFIDRAMLRLDTFWVDSTLGYAIPRWLRVEAYHTSSRGRTTRIGRRRE